MLSQPLTTSDPDTLGGVRVFAGTRVPVKTLFDYLEDDYSLTEFLEYFPSVPREMALDVLEQAEDFTMRNNESLSTALRTIPAKQRLLDQFEQLVRDWKIETSLIASPAKRMLNPNYLRIIKLGDRVLPLLLAELEREPDDWFVALETLAETNPVSTEDRGNFDLVVASWIRWGRENGYI
jgi:uncharacterized protein (DUF433 family)